ncbi:MAG: magnesium transporter [Anaerolineaceae bacterium]|nr:magnesium transporter [Anaerolineaceae bacterium]
MENSITEKIKKYISERSWSALRESVADWPPADITDLLLTLDPPQRIILFHSLPRELGARVFAIMDASQKDTLLAGFTDEETRRLLADLSPDDRTALLEDLPGQVTQRLLNLLGPDDRAEARLLLGFPEESVGRLMTPDYVAVRPNWTVSKALEHIRRRGRGINDISMIYVTDDSWHLVDSLALQRFILAEPDQRVEEIMDYTYAYLSAYDDREQAVLAIERYDLSALPVIESDGVLVGVVTVDDILDVAREEANEDFQKSAAVAPLKASYRETSIWELFQKRIGWLVVLVLVNLFSSGVIAAFEHTLATTIALAFFIPLLIGSGGNAGAQAASLMIRDLATGEIAVKQWAEIMWKEVWQGLLLGVTMGIAAFMLGFLRSGFQLGLVVSLSMLVVILAANLIGILLPFLLTRLKLDPAVASSPLITTLVDSIGLLVYFTIATSILR